MTEMSRWRATVGSQADADRSDRQERQPGKGQAGGGEVVGWWLEGIRGMVGRRKWFAMRATSFTGFGFAVFSIEPAEIVLVRAVDQVAAQDVHLRTRAARAIRHRHHLPQPP